MVVEQIYTGCLAHGAYYIESEGEAVVIDPLREVTPYLERAAKNSAKIKYILETHFHADFVSGHIDLAKKSGGTIVYGPTAKPGFDAYVAEDNEELKVGKVTIQVIHTPGHTMESTCFLLKDEQGKPSAIFTGDTLFIGDAGRPDLAQKVIAELTQDILANHLYDSLRNKIMPLPDDIIVYPGHGAGSACGKNMSKETSDTLGNQKAVNYTLRPDMTREEFVKELLTGLVAPPSYFPQNVLMNIKGYDSIDEVLDRGQQPLTPRAFEAAAEATEALILDTRNPEVFVQGFIPNAINIGVNGNFAPWVGALIPDVKQQILIIAEPGKEEEVITRLARVGYDHCIGYLKGGFESWKAEGRAIDTINNITAEEFSRIYKADKNINILDVRKASEFFSQHLQEATNGPLDFVNDSMQKLDKDSTWYVHCAGGYRSVVFISILKARGFDNLVNISGGFDAIKKIEGMNITDYVCPTTML